MLNRVGHIIPSLAKVMKLEATVRQVHDELAECSVDLTAKERQQAVKFRPGGEVVVSLVGTLATQQGVVLPKISVDEMNNDLALAQRLKALVATVAALQQRIDDTILEAQSECWWAATAYYTTLVRMADADPQLADALKPAIEFFSTGPRQKPVPPTTPSAPSTPTAPTTPTQG